MKFFERFATFLDRSKNEHFGFIERQTVYAIPKMTALSFLANPSKIEKKECISFSLHEVQFLAPLPVPPSFRDAYSFRQHVETSRKNRGLDMIPEFDEFPVFYFSNPFSFTGPGKVEVQKEHLDQLDYELEVSVVLKKGGKNILAQNADEHIWGYCILNDWSARALQMKEMKLNLGPAKGKDFATSMGPYLVSEELLDNGLLKKTPEGERLFSKMQASVNGKILSQGNAKDMRWTFAQIIERASYGVQLQAGDVIGSGTVGTGCLLELNGSGVVKNLWLKPKDVVVLEVEGLGVLENQIYLEGAK